MPRSRKPGDDGKEVKKRSRNGCWPCKSRKVKCGEEKPICSNCQRQGEACDYSIRLNWEGRSRKREHGIAGFQTISFGGPPGLSDMTSPPMAFNPSMANGKGPHAHLAPAPAHIPTALPTGLAEKSRNSSSGSSDQPGLLLSSEDSHGQQQRLHQTHGTSKAPPLLRNPTWGEPTINHQSLAPHTNLRHSISYPSPADSSFPSPEYGQSTFAFNANSYHMPPPANVSDPTMLGDSVSSPYNRAKRMRMSPNTESFGKQSLLSRSVPSSYPNVEDYQKQFFNPATPSYFSTRFELPPTPARSATSHPLENDEHRRISVSSLLSEDPDDSASRKPSLTSYPAMWEPQPFSAALDPRFSVSSRRGSLHQRMISYSETETYGHDRGLPDWDLGRNNDTMAINGGNTPSEHSDFESWLNDTDLGIPEFGFSIPSKDQAFNPGGYYSSPVPIKIPKKLEPLPATLIENPMNLLYFHHFLNHTAKILVPHDCPENPFKTILPKMAIENTNLLNLMLAYSACHRARLLGHKEPIKRIALWVRDVFPSLRQTLDETENTQISNANLATAIMLASLEIISPSSFGIPIQWQSHLSVARGIIRARGGPHSVSRKDPVMFFLTRWLAYLDVLGSLSNRISEEPLYEGNYWQSSYDANSAKDLSLTEDDDGADDDDYTIDCLLGFTTRCVYILAQIASLARQVAPCRIDVQSGTLNEYWKPGPEILHKADKLKADLERALTHDLKPCHHHSPVLPRATLTYAPPPTQNKEAEESLATNEAFHWTAKVHLLRRVYNVPRSEPEVQHAVNNIISKLEILRELGSAEACSLFPTFTAGVETEDKMKRAQITLKLKGAEGLGMMQVTRARRILEECQRTGANWETLVNGDFFG